MISDLDAELAEGIAMVRAFRVADARGARINNLYQTQDGRWRCNVVSADGVADFACGDVASQAILASLDKLPPPRGGDPSEGQEEGRPEVLTPGAEDIFA